MYFQAYTACTPAAKEHKKMLVPSAASHSARYGRPPESQQKTLGSLAADEARLACPCRTHKLPNEAKKARKKRWRASQDAGAVELALFRPPST